MIGRNTPRHRLARAIRPLGESRSGTRGDPGPPGGGQSSTQVVREGVGHGQQRTAIGGQALAGDGVPRPQIAAVQFCGALFGLTLQWLIDPAGADLEPTLARFRERIARELRP